MTRIAYSKRFVIFDLDNCLSNDAGRIAHIDWSKTGAERYAAYHRLCDTDPPGYDARKLIEQVLERGLTPVFFTGRPESVRGQTVNWINANLDLAPYALMMRPTDGDPRHAAELKKWMLHEFCAGEQITASQIAAAWDDRHDVLAMYREFGILSNHRQLHSLSAYCPNEEEKHLQATPEHPFAPIVEPVRDALRELREQAQHLADNSPGVTVCLHGQAVPPTPGSDAAKTLDWMKNGSKTAADILSAAAETFRERNSVYGSNYLMIKKLMDVLFPGGVPSELVHTDRWHLFELMLVKLSRFAISSLTHQDSIRDLTVYGAMVEAALPKEGEQ